MIVVTEILPVCEESNNLKLIGNLLRFTSIMIVQNLRKEFKYFVLCSLMISQDQFCWRDRSFWTVEVDQLSAFDEKVCYVWINHARRGDVCGGPTFSTCSDIEILCCNAEIELCFISQVESKFYNQYSLISGRHFLEHWWCNSLIEQSMQLLRSRQLLWNSPFAPSSAALQNELVFDLERTPNLL